MSRKNLTRGSGRAGERDQIHFDQYTRTEGDIGYGKWRRLADEADESLYETRRASQRRNARSRSGYYEEDGFVVPDGWLETNELASERRLTGPRWFHEQRWVEQGRPMPPPPQLLDWKESAGLALGEHDERVQPPRPSECYPEWGVRYGNTTVAPRY